MDTRRPELYTFRDQQGLEVDFVIPKGPRELLLVEAKASRTAHPAMAGPLLRLREALKNRKTLAFLAYRPGRDLASLSALREGVRAGSLETLLGLLEERTPS